MTDRITNRRPIHEGWLGLSMLTLELDTGETIERELVEHPSGAAVLAYDPERRVAMVTRQSRPPLIDAGEPPMIEVLAGALDEDPPEVCARREAMEEGGIALHDLEPVGIVWANSSTSTERIHLFLARYQGADRVAEGGGLDEEAEHIRVLERPLAALAGLVAAGEVRDAKTLILLQALQLRRPALFDR